MTKRVQKMQQTMGKVMELRERLEDLEQTAQYHYTESRTGHNEGQAVYHEGSYEDCCYAIENLKEELAEWEEELEKVRI